MSIRSPRARHSAYAEPPADSVPSYPVDPAEVAGEAILARALAACPSAMPALTGSPAFVVVTTPAPGWNHVLRGAWQRAADHARAEAAGTGDRLGDEDGGPDWPERHVDGFRPVWTGQPYSGRRLGEAVILVEGAQVRPDADAVEDASWRGCGVVAFSSDPGCDLPADVVSGTDVRLAVEAPGPDEVAHVARTLTGGPPSRLFPQGLAGTVTPRLLRLARRVGQDADDYVARLAALAGAAALPAAVDATPRDAPTLDRLHGMHEATAWGQDVARDLAAFDAGTLAWADVDRGCLLSGPPGCGKTLFARALAATCGVPLVCGSYGQWLGTGNAHQGDLLKAMRKTFADARAKSPCILFIDEVDSFPNRGTIRHRYAEWEIQVVNALLAEIDGVEGRDGVVLVAACNHPDRLDPALVRSGRLDRHVVVGMPDRAALAAILREHLGQDGAGWDLTGAALLADGSTGADCERHVRGACRRARTAGRPLVLADLLEEIGGAAADPRAVHLAAVHEAGHAVVSHHLYPGSVSSVSVRATATAMGHMSGGVVPTSVTADRLFGQIVIVLAGRAAEEVILGAASSGSGGPFGSDLATATYLAAVGAAALGFDPDVGLAWRGMPDRRTLAEVMAVNSVDASVSRTVADAYDEARCVVADRRASVEALAAELVRCTVLDGAAVADILDRHADVPGGGTR